MAEKIIEGRYFTTMTGAVAIVAMIGDYNDWAAYICDCPGTDSIEHSNELAAYFGAKLSEKDARYFFPDIELKYRQ